MMEVIRTEQIRIGRSKKLDELSTLTNNLYNHANFIVRQNFFHNRTSDGYRKYLNFYALDKLSKTALAENTSQLPAQTVQSLYKVLDSSWKAFFKSIKSVNMIGKKIRPPKYRTKGGRHQILFTNQQCKLKDGFIYFPKTLGIEPVETRLGSVKLRQVRIIPSCNHFTIEIVYKTWVEPIPLDKNNVAGIDFGINNLAMLVSQRGVFAPVLINGKPLKSVNQFYNKKLAQWKSQAELNHNTKSTKRIQRLHIKRNAKVKDYLHKASSLIVKHCIEYDVGTLVIGWNNGFKDGCNMGKRNNQNFIQLPLGRLKEMIQYKAESAGIVVEITEESYTSKASAFDNDDLPVYEKGVKNRVEFSGKRIKRGLYKTTKGILLNADVNGALNIIRKVCDDVSYVDQSNRGLLCNPVKALIAS